MMRGSRKRVLDWAPDRPDFSGELLPSHTHAFPNAVYSVVPLAVGSAFFLRTTVALQR